MELYLRLTYREGAMNPLVRVTLIATSLLGSTACANLEFKPYTPGADGLMYYAPDTFVVVTVDAACKPSVSAITLADPTKPYTVNFKAGLALNKSQVEFENGTIKKVNAEVDNKTIADSVVKLADAAVGSTKATMAETCDAGVSIFHWNGRNFVKADGLALTMTPQVRSGQVK